MSGWVFFIGIYFIIGGNAVIVFYYFTMIKMNKKSTCNSF